MPTIEEELVQKAERRLVEIFLESQEYNRILLFLEGDNNVRPNFSIDCDRLLQEVISETIDSNVSVLIAKGFTPKDISQIREYVYHTLLNSTCVVLTKKLKIISILASKVIEMKKQIDHLTNLQLSMIEDIKNEIEELKK